jgi:hypothetical protein
MIPSVSQYAGQQLLTGQQAEAYADHFIAVHALGGLALAGTLFGLTLGRRPEITHEAIPSADPKDVTTA